MLIINSITRRLSVSMVDSKKRPAFTVTIRAGQETGRVRNGRKPDNARTAASFSERANT